MGKKHFICTHTWLNEDAKKQGTEFTSNMTEKEFFDSVKTDKACLLYTSDAADE